MPEQKKYLLITFFNLLFYLWQLPQHLLALVMRVILSRKIVKTNTVEFKNHKHTISIFKAPSFGVSLGDYIFMDVRYSSVSQLHELGHSIQSRMLGIFYLPIVGISSSIFNNFYDRWFHKKWTNNRRIYWYYNRLVEKWADRLAGVERPWVSMNRDELNKFLAN